MSVCSGLKLKSMMTLNSYSATTPKGWDYRVSHHILLTEVIILMQCGSRPPLKARLFQTTELCERQVMSLLGQAFVWPCGKCIGRHLCYW